MQAPSIVRAVRLCLLAGIFMAGTPYVAASWAQDVALSSQSPRFLLASRAGRAPVEVKAADNALLRRVVSLTVAQPTIGALLAEIEQQAGLRFGFSRDVVPVARAVTLRAERITVGAALLSILMDTGVDVLLSPDGKVALVQRGTTRLAQQGALAGRVTDGKTGAGVAGAEVLLGGSRWRTNTDTAGRYRLTAVEEGRYTLIVRRIGYARHERLVTIAQGEDTVDVVLEPQPKRLDSLVSTATGQQRRRSITNAISTIKADSVLQNAVVRSVSDLLANRVTGLTAQHTSGAPGDPTKLRLRGIHSVYGSNDPVVFVDGIRVYAAQSNERSGNLTNLAPGGILSEGAKVERVMPTDVPAPSPLDQIDPNTIEKIEVVKGPSAATLYGADAANGVILITTKRGKAGPTQWNASFTHRSTTTLGTYPTAFFQWGHDSLTGFPQFCTLAVTSCVVDSVVQFQSLNDATLTPLGRGHANDISLSARGGTRALTYSVTGTYDAETGLLTLPAFEVDRFHTLYNRAAPDWMRRPHQLDKWSVSSAVQAALGTSANLTLTTTLSRTEQSRTSLEGQLASMAGTYVDTLNGLYYRPSSRLTDGQLSGDHLPYQFNATTAVLDSYYIKTTASFLQFRSGLNLDWRPLPWLAARGEAGLDVQPRNDQSLLEAGLLDALDSGHIAVATDRTLLSTFGIGATATKPLGLGFRFQTTVGVNLNTTTTTTIATTAAGLASGTSSLSGARRTDASQFGTNTSSFGWYVAPELVGERIAISAGLRLDGGNAYGARVSGGSGLLKLPKIGGAWVISEEPWFPLGSLFQSLKLRGSYGQAQVQPGPTDRLRLYVGSTNQLGSGLIVNNIGNVDLRPERATEIEGGFEGQLFDDRLSLDLTWHYTKQVDALMPTQLPGSVHGGGAVFQNVGDVLNTGVELDASLTPVRQSMVTWSVGLRYTRQDNKLVKLGPGVAEDRVQGRVEGFPIDSRWARPILGYGDQNGDGVLQLSEIQLGDTLVYMGRLLPAYTSQVTTNLSLFGGMVGLAADVSYVSGATQVDQTARANWVLARGLVDPTSSFADQAAVLASTNPYEGRRTDYGLTQDISTFRLDNLSLSYRAPASVTRLLRAQQLRVAVQGSNLAMHSTYSGGRDPDVSAWRIGNGIIDTGQLPQPRTWQVRFDVAY